MYRVNAVSASGVDVPYEFFGVNAVYKANTTSGAPNDSFTASLEALGVTHVRFPAGQGDDADVDAEGTDWLNIVRMDGNNLNPDVRAFMDWCVDNNITASLVIPTKHMSATAYTNFGPDITAFAKKLLADYPDVVTAFEIGNEYWEMGETAYAAKANIAVQALEDAFDDLGLSASQAPDTLVQMATPNSGSEFTASAPGMSGIGYRTRIEMANEKIIAELDQDTLDAIDGLVEHYYYKRSADLFSDDENETNFITRDIATWHNALGRNVDVHITEWNVQADNMNQTGLKSTGVMVFQIEQMLRMGVDAAQIWAVQHNTTSDLTGPDGAAPITDAQDRVESTVRGALFDVLSDTLPGMELLDLDFNTTISDAYVSAYQSDEELVVIIASRSEEAESYSFDFDAITGDFHSVSGTKISIDLTDEGGSHWDPKQKKFVTPDGADLDGNGVTDFFYAEHDLRAQISDLNAPALLDEGDVVFALNPYETIVLTFSDPGDHAACTFRCDPQDPDSSTGTQTQSSAAVMGDVQTLWAGLDNDRITGGAGDDWIYGGTGSDTVAGGEGHDTFEFRDDSLETDIIRDFNATQDTLVFNMSSVSSLSDLTFTQTERNSIEITIDGQSGSLELQGVWNPEDLMADGVIEF